MSGAGEGAGGRRPVVATLEEAVAQIFDGAVVGLGGAVTAGHPMALVRALARRGARDLTLVAPTGGIEVDLLIAAGSVRAVIGSYVGIEVVAGVGPVFRRAVEAGEVEVIDLDEAHCVQGLRAAGQELPFLPWRGGVGTSFPQLNPTLIEFDDPVAGEPLLAIPAIRLDFALLYAETADRYGNAQWIGTGHMDQLLGAAAERVLLQVDRIVSNETIRAQPERTVYWRDTVVTRAPFGTHPYSNAHIAADEQHLRAFAKAGRAGGEALDEYLARHVRDTADHDDYLEAIGIRRLTSLLV
ncbi:CoA transferase subunit A [Conexibacter sp. CPCC 206217]|uniref:CoA transferase subunit A n=1 Tax=Conexibacter sp. CPCC 206217 TaxID=3064574 RepID=UPI0027258893|nr:CoA-transferase [Conexibacter sp. CPCC 206217]MDO8212436.1 CoA-transferase [Conexibacter sp. CPCC 206217]